MNLTPLFENSVAASRAVNILTDDTIKKILFTVADKAVAQTPFLLAENQKDLERMPVTDPKYDRLLLTEARIAAIAQEMRNVANLPTPLGKILEEKILPNGLHLQKVSVPLGVVGIIYEARPNVTFDCFALSLKSGNAVVLKGGSDAEFSNIAIVKLIHDTLVELQIEKNIIQLLPAQREATAELLNAVGYVDVLIPRGSQQLIDYVRQHAKVPVIETGAGIVHAYVDADADVEKAKKVVFNAKTRRVSVCNALDCLIIHQSQLPQLPAICKNLVQKKVIIYADERAKTSLTGHYPENLLFDADEKSFGTEFLDYKMAIKTVETLEQALAHIAKYSSKHSECVVSENPTTVARFFKEVDAAAVYANASTAFTDGAQFGMGAEIGISTQKLHARGPMALPELTSYKWLINGNGHTRS